MGKQSEIAGELVDVLKRSKQVVPPELQQIADEVKSGKRENFWKSWEKGGSNYKSGGSNWKSGDSDWKGGGGGWKNGSNGWKDKGDTDWKAKDDWKSKDDWKGSSWKTDDSKENTGGQQPEAPSVYPQQQPQELTASLLGYDAATVSAYQQQLLLAQMLQPQVSGGFSGQPQVQPQ